MPGTELVGSLLGSVALLLWGVRMVRTGMMRTFGAVLRRAIAVHTRGRVRAFLAGLGVTGLLQSSTATALLLASFSSRGLVALPIALSVILGADVGSSIVAQVFSFDVKWIWTLLVATGVFIFMAAYSDRMRGIGRIALGLGLMLLALGHLGAAAAPLRTSPTFQTVLSGLAGEPVLAFFVAVFLTWVSHSSLSIVLLLMSFAAAHVLPLPLAFALVLGANVGGALAPLLSLSGSPPAVRRVPLGNVMMRTIVALPLLAVVGPAANFLEGIEDDPGRLVIDFHTAFNVMTALVFLPVVGFIANLTARVLPDKPEAVRPGQPKHLDANVLDLPSEALACALRETLHLGEHVAGMLRNALVALEKSDSKLVREVENADDAVDQLHEAIKLYLVKLSEAGMSEEESRRYADILTFTTNLEHVGDIIDKNLMELASKKIKHRYTFSLEGINELRQFHSLIMDNMRLAMNVFATRDVNLARRLIGEKVTIRAAEQASADNHYARLRQGRPESIETTSIHLDVIRDLKRVSGHLISVAYPILESVGELGDTRLLVRDTQGLDEALPIT